MYFIGWIIGHTFFMKWTEFILVRIQQTNSIKSNIRIQSNKYIMSEFRNSMLKIFLVFLFVIFFYCSCLKFYILNMLTIFVVVVMIFIFHALFI